MNPPDDQNLLRESGEKYRALVETTGTAYVINISDYTIQLASKNLGINLPLGITCHALTHRSDKPCDDADNPCPIEKVKQSGKDVVLVHTHYDAHGNARLVELHASPVVDSQGHIVQVIESTLDITERRQVEETLSESEEKYRALVETTGTGYVIIDSEGRVLDANREYIRLTGHEALEEIRGRRVTEWTAQYDLARNAEEVGKCMERGFVHNLEIDYVNKAGKFTPVEMNATVLPMAEGTRIVTLCRDISERRRLEDQLRVKDWAIESASNAFAISDLAGNLNYVNPAFLKLWGFRTREEILGKPATGFWQMGEKAVEVMEGLRTRGGWSGEMVAKSKEGALFDVQVAASLVLDDVGRPFCMLASFVDITERKRTEGALQESEQRFKAIFDHSNDGILLADMEKKRFFIGNETICQMLGYSPDEIKDLGVMDIHPAEDLPYVIDQFEKQARKEIAIAKDLPVVRKDGSVFYADVSAFPITLVGKTYLVGAFRDTTERKQAEDSLRQSEERFRVLFEQAADIILLMEISPRGLPVIRDANNATFRLLGYERDEMIGQPVSIIEAERDASKVVEERREAVLSESGKKIFEAKHRCKDGTVREFECSVTEMQIGSKTFAISVERDITERKSLEAQLIQAQKMEAVGLLAGGIAHEFNNILGGILGYASLMRLKMEPDHPFWGYVETIEKSSQRAAVLTSQLLGFARKGKYDLRLLSLNLLAEDTLAIVRQTFDRAVTVEARLAESLPKVEGDTMQLQQVLMNLCINARDAMPQGGSLVLTTGTEQVAEGDERIPPESKAGLYVLLSVADTGCGMDEETQAKIFEPFFTTKEKGKGTGLGLAMVYGVVKNHGGFVTVQSEVGRGSVFTLHLPAAEKPAERRPEALAAPERSRGAVSDQTILVVDDEENIRFLARDILEGEGYRVLLAEDGARALEVYREHQGEIGLVVLDLIMPKLGGGEVFLKMREMDPGMHVLVSSGYSQEGKAQEILSGGALGFVQKPFHVRDLISKVRQGLDGKEGYQMQNKKCSMQNAK